MKDSKLITDDGRILPEDKKYLTKSSAFNKKSFRSPKKKGLIDDLFLQPEQYVFLKTDEKRDAQLNTQQQWMTRTFSLSAITPLQVDKTGGVINLTHLDTVTK